MSQRSAAVRSSTGAMRRSANARETDSNDVASPCRSSWEGLAGVIPPPRLAPLV
jgi:hypothetical protein